MNRPHIPSKFNIRRISKNVNAAQGNGSTYIHHQHKRAESSLLDDSSGIFYPSSNPHRTHSQQTNNYASSSDSSNRYNNNDNNNPSSSHHNKENFDMNKDNYFDQLNISSLSQPIYSQLSSSQLSSSGNYRIQFSQEDDGYSDNNLANHLKNKSQNNRMQQVKNFPPLSQSLYNALSPPPVSDIEEMTESNKVNTSQVSGAKEIDSSTKISINEDLDLSSRKIDQSFESKEEKIIRRKERLRSRENLRIRRKERTRTKRKEKLRRTIRKEKLRRIIRKEETI